MKKSQRPSVSRGASGSRGGDGRRPENSGADNRRPASRGASPRANRPEKVRTSVSKQTISKGSSSKGAVHSRVGLVDRFDAYMAHHSSSAIHSLARLLETPWQSLMTWLVIAIAIALPAALYVGFANVQNLAESWEGSSQISVFLRPEASDAKAEDIRGRLAQRADIAKVVYVSPAQGLAEFRAQSGLGEIIDSLDRNPLPGTLLVTPKLQNTTDAAITSLQQSLVADPMVAEVRLDLQWVKRLHAFTLLGQQVVFGLAGLLALGVLMVIGNSIRMAVDNRRDEILVVKLVGGTDAYVARPFLYTGFWYGIGGGLIALGIIGLAQLWVGGTTEQLANLYQSGFRLQGLGIIGGLQLVIAAGLIGVLGAYVAVTRHLSRIQPR